MLWRLFADRQTAALMRFQKKPGSRLFRLKLRQVKTVLHFHILLNVKMSAFHSSGSALKKLAAGIVIVVLLAVVSLFTGVSDVNPGKLFAGDTKAWSVFWATRVPRTVSIILAGISMAIAGTIMQLLTRNRFVEPSTAGTVESASLGLLAVMLIAPSLPVYAKMLCAAISALLGTALFIQLVKRIPLHSVLVVPLAGIMLGSVIHAVTSFFAYRYDMLQSVLVWTSGDFSSVMEGRYELLWIAAPLTLAAYIAADRFTVAGLGEDFTTSLGVNYRQIITLGLIIVATVTALVVITVGQIPFLGLIVPNIVVLMLGDNMRRTIPWVALLGAALVLTGDIAGRLIRFPYEIPIGTMMGVIGSALFLYLLLRGRNRLA